MGSISLSTSRIVSEKRVLSAADKSIMNDPKAQILLYKTGYILEKSPLFQEKPVPDPIDAIDVDLPIPLLLLMLSDDPNFLAFFVRLKVLFDRFLILPPILETLLIDPESFFELPSVSPLELFRELLFSFASRSFIWS